MNEEMKPPTEEELQAAFAEQMRQIRVEDVILQTTATLLNLAALRLGLTEDPEAQPDAAQAKLAIDAARVLLPLCPESQQGAIRQALSQLQMAFATATQGAEDSGQPDASQAPPAGQPDDAAERAKAREKLWTPPGSGS